MQSHLWKDIKHLNGYIERCQRQLQQGETDSDVLVYFPIHDLWSKPAKEGGIHQLDVHHTEKWLHDSEFGKLVSRLDSLGVMYDYLSDSLLNLLTYDPHRHLASGRKQYSMIVVPNVTYMPLRSLQKLYLLAHRGTHIIFERNLPGQGVGFNTHQDEYLKIKDKLRRSKRVHVAPSLSHKHLINLYHEHDLVKNGLSFIRKKNSHSERTYFIANLSNKFEAGWITLGAELESALVNDPIRDSTKVLKFKQSGKTRQYYLRLPPGQSCFINGNIRMSSTSKSRGVPSSNSADESINSFATFKIKSQWDFSFGDGRPSINHQQTMDSPTPWTTLTDSASYFYGSGIYTTTFTASPEILNSKELTIDLGNVNEVADVTLNGIPIGTAWCIPYQLPIPKSILKAENKLVVTVRNLSNNYMRLYDQKHPEWKKFYDINIVDIQYKLFDGSKLTIMPSGLNSDVVIRYR